MNTTDIKLSRAGAFGQLPLAFIPNTGQMDSSVHYYVKGPSHAIYFTSSNVVFKFAGKGSAPRNVLSDPPSSNVKDGFVLQFRFAGANPEVKLEGRRLGEGKVHYFIGNDPSRWFTDLPTYGELVYRDIWPGIDLAFQGENGRLKYTFVIQPGVSLENIRLTYQGAKDFSLDDYGNLQIHTPGGLLKDEKPVSYQEAEGKTAAVTSDFVLEQDVSGDLYFSLEAGPEYNRGYPLILDAGLIYSAYLGGSKFDIGNSIALDAAGNAYITGSTESLNFPVTAGVLQTSPSGDNDVFVTKLNADRTALVYSAYLGGSGSDSATGIAVDAATGEAYVTGTTNSVDFPVTQNAFQSSLAGGFDVFVTKLNAAGGVLEYSTYLGGGGLDIGQGITVVAGSAYITGSTDSLNFPVTSGVVQPAKAGDGDAFVTKLNAAGTALDFSTYLGGPRSPGGIAVFSAGLGIDTDATGNVYVGGNTTSPHFPVTPAAFQRMIGSSSGVGDGFVTKLNPAGTAFVYSTYLGGNLADGINSIAVSPAGNAYVTGSTSSTNFPVTPGAFQTFLGGLTDAFVTQLNAEGSALVYSTYLGGSAADAGRGIKIDTSGNAYVTGDTASGNYPVTPGAIHPVQGGSGDAILTILNAAGNALLFSTYLGGSGLDSGTSIALDAAGNVYLTGNNSSVNFPVTARVFQPELAGGTDGFVTRSEPALLPPSPPEPPIVPPPPPFAPPASKRRLPRRKFKNRRLNRPGLRRAAFNGRGRKGQLRLSPKVRIMKRTRLKRSFLIFWRREISNWVLSQLRTSRSGNSGMKRVKRFRRKSR